MWHARLGLVIMLLLLAGLVQAASITLTWMNPTLNADGTPLIDLDHLNLYRCQGVNCDPVYQRSVGLVSSVVDAGLVPETVYTYQVTAVDTGGLESVRSNVALALTPADPSPTGGLVAAYGLNEGGGLAVGDAMGGPTGLISGATWTASGRYGQALSFDGVNDRVIFQPAPALPVPSTAITVSVWIRPVGISQPWASILQRVHGTNYLSYAIAQVGDQPRQLKGYLQINGTVVSPPATKRMTNQTWYYAVLTWAAGQPVRLVLYRENGTVFDDTRTAAVVYGTLTEDTQPLLMGEDESGHHWAGRIDEVRIYSRALTASDIQSDMHVGIP